MKKEILLQKIKKILPSKQLGIFMLIGVIIISLLFLFLFVFSKNEKFTSKKSRALLENKTVADLIQADTDSDGILDWEEVLWGTDKNNKMTYPPLSDIDYVSDKRKELKLEQDMTSDSVAETETDKFAREFFTSYLSLRSGGVDKELIDNFSNSVGQNLTKPNLINKYTLKDVEKTLVNTPDEKIKYYTKLSEVFEKSKEAGIGDELEIVSQGILIYDATESANFDELLLISDAYNQFGEDIMTIPVPESLVTYHLNMANASNNTGISVANMIKVVDDPVVGISGISQYQQYSEDLIKASEDMQKAIQTTTNQ